MLNLIVIGNTDYYKFFSENRGEASFPVSRLFESTSDSLRSKLLPLTEKTFQFLQELPVVFMSEPEMEYDENQQKIAVFSQIRIGRISNVRTEKKNGNRC
ncbi:hypothetical protein ACSJL2_000465 [Serratia sarumanii]|uniref:hypothetical protein n=1 Tax=Serratia sarumanii TaxID=3020826 RepID=UPI003F6B5A3E